MSEAAGRAEMERRVIERSLHDDVFRQQLLADPRAIIEREIGTQLPEDVRVVAVEETADTIYLVLPSASPVVEGGELADQTLEAVAGGDAGSTSTASLCNLSCDPNCMY
jgi:Nitrile hydratase, alpha chain